MKFRGVATFIITAANYTTFRNDFSNIGIIMFSTSGIFTSWGTKIILANVEPRLMFSGNTADLQAGPQ